jgi:hypothetical protein
MKYAVMMSALKFPSLAKYTVMLKGADFSDPHLYWCHADDKFVYSDGPRTLYATREEAEGGILWIIARKGQHYMGDQLEVVEVRG